MWGHVSQSKGFTVWAWTHALLQMKLELSPRRYFVWWGLKVSEKLKYYHFFQANPCETFSTCLLAIISKFSFMVYSYKENKLFLPTFPIGNIWLKCGLHVARVHSHSSPDLQGLCKPLWNVPRPLRHPHPGREKTVWYLSYIGLPTLLLRGIRDILLLFCLWPSIALQSLFFSPLWWFTYKYVQDRTVSHGGFSHSDTSSSRSIFQFKKWLANVENMGYNIIDHDVWCAQYSRL